MPAVSAGFVHPKTHVVKVPSLSLLGIKSQFLSLRPSSLNATPAVVNWILHNPLFLVLPLHPGIVSGIALLLLVDAEACKLLLSWWRLHICKCEEGKTT